jgi:hypothetical protein
LEDDWDVGGVEELDWVASGVSSDLFVVNSDIDLESLEVVNDQEDEDSGQQVIDIWGKVSVESLLD